MRLPYLGLLLAAAVVPPLVACGSDGQTGDATPTPSGTTTTKPGPGSSSSGSTDTDTDSDSGTEMPPQGCARTAKATDYTRKVVISHPFHDNSGGTGGNKANKFEVLELSTSGDLTKTNVTFEMHTAFSEIAFTPDGEIGLVAQDDGTIGAFKIGANGAVTVIDPGFKGTFYASHIVMSKDGTRAFALDPDTKENRGGVHEIRIGCDGKLTDVGLVVPGGKAHAMALIPTDPDRAILIAGAAFDSPAGDYAHKLDLVPSPPARLAGGSVFDDDKAIASWVAVTPDGKWALVTDNGLFAGNRMAPVETATMKKGATIPVTNPAGVAMSPFNNAALLMESDGDDHLKRVTYDPANPTTPFAVAGEIAYVGGKTALPVLASVIEVGTLKGHVLVAENDGVRHLVFEANGTITDKGRPFVYDGIDGIVGSLGVQP